MSNAKEDFPDPESPVITVNLSLGIFRDIFLIYKFSFLKKQNIKKRIFAYYYLFTNFNFQKKYFISKIIIIPRNILRRLFILFSPRLVKFIYRFH